MEYAFTNLICTDDCVTSKGGKKIWLTNTTRSICIYISVHKWSEITRVGPKYVVLFSALTVYDFYNCHSTLSYYILLDAKLS